jgi:hypothetical protein
VWAAAAFAGIVVLQALALFAVNDRELLWLGREAKIDQTFLRHMSTHHQQGIELASMAAEKAASQHLQSLAKLMAASQNGEKRILENWWTSSAHADLFDGGAGDHARPAQPRANRTAYYCSFTEFLVSNCLRHNS